MRTVVRHTIDLLLYSNCWVAFCLSGLVLGVAHRYCIHDCWLFAAFAFLGTFATYTFHRLVRNRSFQRAAIITERSSWQNRQRQLLIVVCGFAATAGAVLFFFLPVKPLSILLLGVSGIVVLFYAMPFPRTNKTLRSLRGTKNYWILLVWLVLICIPMINRGKAIEPLDLLVIGMFVFIQIIPFDIRDVIYDPPSMQTLPQLMGITGARIFATLLLAIATGLLLDRYGFSWLLLLTALCSLAGTWWRQDATRNRYLELLWEAALLCLGIYYYFLPCS